MNKQIVAKRAAEHFRQNPVGIDSEELQDYLDDPHHVYRPDDRLEREHFQWIADGDLERVEKSFREDYDRLVLERGTFAKDAKKHFEYAAVMMTVHCTTVSINAGVTPEKAYTVREFFLQKISEASDVDMYYNLSFEALMSFTRIISATLKQRTGNYYFDRASEYISHHLYDKIYIQDIAEYLRISPDYLCKVFRSTVGLSPQEYYRKEKIKVACSLLRNTSYSISEIAYRLGFSSQSHFGKYFRVEMGVTPGNYKLM